MQKIAVQSLREEEDAPLACVYYPVMEEEGRGHHRPCDPDAYMRREKGRGPFIQIQIGYF